MASGVDGEAGAYEAFFAHARSDSVAEGEEVGSDFLKGLEVEWEGVRMADGFWEGFDGGDVV